MKIHKTLLQGSPEWLKARVSRITASQSESLMATKGLGAGAVTYAIELIAEDILQVPKYVPETFAMERGLELEPFARDIYSRSRNVTVDEIGGIEDGILWASPDGLIGDDGILEIKCPMETQYIRCLIDPKARDKYFHQIQFLLMISGRKWCDLMFFHPDFPDPIKAKVFRIERDQDYIDLIIERIEEFKVLMSEIEVKLKA